MGYDMHMVNEPNAVPDGLALQNPDMPGYHRYNIRGMPVTVGAMEWADCIRYAKMPEFPPIPDVFPDGGRAGDVIYAVNNGKLELLDSQPSPEEIAAAQAWLTANRAVTDAPPSEDGIPRSYKFESNAGWLVHPEECRTIATRIRANMEMIARDFFTDAGISYEDGLAWLTSWADYNQLAAEHGGYRVY